jgi:PEP-CTERM motif
MKFTSHFWHGGLLAAVLSLSPSAHAFNPQPDPPVKLSYVSFEIFNSVETFANGINNQGLIAGYSNNGITLAHGYKMAAGVLTQYDAPGAVNITEHYGINGAGAVSGAYYDGAKLLGYVQSGNSFQSLDPGGPRSVAWGLNDTGKVVGSYEPNGSTDRGFLWNGSSFSDVMVPGSVSTQARDIDSSGRIVGWSVDAQGLQHGFSLVGTAYTPFNVPGDQSFGTRIFGTNDHGWTVGGYGDATSARHGFVRDGSTTFRIDIPGALWTEVRGVNDQLTMVGAWGDADGVTVHGFSATMSNIASVPEPQSWALFGLGGLALWLRGRRRRTATMLQAVIALAATSGLSAQAASDHWVQAWVDARGNGVTQQQDTGQVNGPVASAGPVGFNVSDANGSFSSNISGNAAYGHLWGAAAAAQHSPNFPRQSDANADMVSFQDRLTLTSATLPPGTFVSFTVTEVLTDRLSSGPGTCCANVAVNGKYGFGVGNFNFGDQAQAGQTIDHQVTRTVILQWAIGTPTDVGAVLFYDVGSSPGINALDGSSRVDLADVVFYLTLPSGVSVTSSSGHDYSLPVPEPGAALLMAMGVALLLSARRFGGRR